MTRLFYIFSVFALFFFACQEIPPIVKIPDDPPPPPPSPRMVLIEEFTGVECIKCPDGSAVIEDLIAIHGSRLIAISIHTGELADPYPESLYDFNTVEGDALLNYLGQPFGFPSAVINRKKFEGQFDLQLGRDDWPGYVALEKEDPPMVNIDIEPTFDAASREVAIDVTMYIKETITHPDVRFSLVFTETDIVDAQLTPGSSPDVDTDYVHKHVLRGMATPYDGITLTEDLTIGTQLTKSFSYTIPAEWKEANVNIVAFVSLNGEEKEILQAHEVHLIE